MSDDFFVFSCLLMYGAVNYFLDFVSNACVTSSLFFRAVTRVIRMHQSYTLLF